MRKPARLTESFVHGIDHKGVYTDGHGGYGLRLSVMPRARGGVRKAWRQRPHHRRQAKGTWLRLIPTGNAGGR